MGLTATFKLAGVREVNVVTESQLEADAGLMAILKPIGGPLVSETDCGAGVKPVCTSKVKEGGLTASMGLPVTVSITGIERVVPEEGTMETFPLYKPATRPEAFAVTVTVAGVAPDAGVTESQPVVVTVEAAVEKFTDAPLEATVSVCCPELLAPDVVRLKASAAGVADTRGEELTVNVTGICRGVPALTGAIVTTPMYVPAVSVDKPVMPTVTVAGVDPEDPPTTANQPPPLVTEAVNEAFGVLELSAKLWLAGCAPLVTYVNVRLVGLALN